MARAWCILEEKTENWALVWITPTNDQTETIGIHAHVWSKLVMDKDGLFAIDAKTTQRNYSIVTLKRGELNPRPFGTRHLWSEVPGSKVEIAFNGTPSAIQKKFDSRDIPFNVKDFEEYFLKSVKDRFNWKVQSDIDDRAAEGFKCRVEQFKTELVALQKKFGLTLKIDTDIEYQGWDGSAEATSTLVMEDTLKEGSRSLSEEMTLESA